MRRRRCWAQLAAPTFLAAAERDASEEKARARLRARHRRASRRHRVRGEAVFAGVQREPCVQKQRTWRRRAALHEIFDNDEGGAVFALLEKSGGEPELGRNAERFDRERAFEQCLGFVEATTTQNDFGHVQQQRRVLRRESHGFAQRGWNERRIERV